jgi:protein-S-isoprenylcysteine O-methyltransferase Ste14
MALWIAPREEAELVEKFSDEYQHYQQRTGRFIPRLRTPS